jgi:Fe-S-cluster containining protein
MEQQKQLSENDRILYLDGYNIGKSVNIGDSNNRSLFKASRIIYKNIDSLNISLLENARKQGITIACKEGCSWCCHQAVYVITPELEYLASYIKHSFSEEIKDKIYKRANEKYRVTKKLGKEKLHKHKSPCPLLFDGKCIAYDARPMACRIYLSSKVSTCEEFYNNPENKENYPALMEFPLQAGRMINEGFTRALIGKEYKVEETTIEEGLVKIQKTKG